MKKFNEKGFTLIELLVAAATIGIISVISVKLLFTTVISRARQESIQKASDDVQVSLETISKTIKESKRISLDSSSQISTEGSVCRSYRLNSYVLEMAEDFNAECTAPTSGFVKITNENTVIEKLLFTKNDKQIDIGISGYTKDSFGKHEFDYQTTVVKRTD